MLPAFVERAVALSTSLGLEPRASACGASSAQHSATGVWVNRNPAELYTQALVQGYVIILRAGDRFTATTPMAPALYIWEYQKLQGT